MKVFAFLDVESTLIYNNSVINFAFLEKLKEKNMKDIYLFSEFSIKELASIGSQEKKITHFELVKILENQGFKVHGVITPADPGNFVSEANGEQALHDIGQAYETLYKPLAQKNKPIEGASIDYLVDYYWNSHIWDKAVQYTIDSKETAMGAAKDCEIPQLVVTENRSGEKTVCTSRQELKDTLMRLRRDKIAYHIGKWGSTDEPSYRTVTGSYNNNKAIMMDLAVKQLTQKYEDDLAIFYADDENDHLTATTQVIKNFNHKAAKDSKAYLANDKTDASESTDSEASTEGEEIRLVPINAVGEPLKEKEEKKFPKVMLHTLKIEKHMPEIETDEIKAYETAMDDFKRAIAPVTILDRIDEELNTMKAKRTGGIYIYDADEKTVALTLLKTQLENASKGDLYKEIITKWENDRSYKGFFGGDRSCSSMLNSHRNVFSLMSSFITREKTKTFLFIAQLKKEFGDFGPSDDAFIEDDMTASDSKSKDNEMKDDSSINKRNRKFFASISRSTSGSLSTTDTDTVRNSISSESDYSESDQNLIIL